MAEDIRTVELPERLVQRVEARLEYTEFDTVEDYLEFAVEGLLRGVEERSDGEDPPDPDEGIRDRLESLGYL